MDGLIGAAWAAEFGGVHVEEALDHFVAVERGEEEEAASRARITSSLGR